MDENTTGLGGAEGEGATPGLKRMFGERLLIEVTLPIPLIERLAGIERPGGRRYHWLTVHAALVGVIARIAPEIYDRLARVDMRPSASFIEVIVDRDGAKTWEERAAELRALWQAASWKLHAAVIEQLAVAADLKRWQTIARLLARSLARLGGLVGRLGPEGEELNALLSSRGFSYNTELYRDPAEALVAALYTLPADGDVGGVLRSGASSPAPSAPEPPSAIS